LRIVIEITSNKLVIGRGCRSIETIKGMVEIAE
jgi:hypothetical protein